MNGINVVIVGFVKNGMKRGKSIVLNRKHFKPTKQYFRFTFVPFENLPLPVGEIYLHAEMDDWKPVRLVQAEEKKESSIYEIYRMVPPNFPHHFFFSVDNTAYYTSIEHDIVTDYFPFNDDNTDAELLLSLKNTYNVVSVEERPEDALFRIAPRCDSSESDDDWFPDSIFAPYFQDTPALLKEALHSDWKMGKVSRFNTNDFCLFYLCHYSFLPYAVEKKTRLNNYYWSILA